MLKVENLSVYYPPYSILKHISFILNKNERIAIVGKSGCGKSTLLEAIAGIHFLPQSTCKLQGSIELNGKAMSSTAKCIHFMQQNDLLLEWLKAVDNVALALRISGMKKHEARKHASNFLKEFNLDAYAHYYPSQLSGGMRQRIALLRTCIDANSNPLVLLDEPFAKLDMITKQECKAWASDLLNKISASCILVSHDIEEAIEFSHRILVISSSSLHKSKKSTEDDIIQNHNMRDLAGKIVLSINCPSKQDYKYQSQFLATKEEILRHL